MKLKRKFFVVTAVFLCTALILTHERILLAVGDFLVVQDKLSPCDVIHVIAGEDYRTDYAIRLYKQGYGRLIFFTGGWCKIHRHFHGWHGRERALEQGIPGEALAGDDSTVTSTYSEIVRLKAFMARTPAALRSVIVVSDPHHMRRARWVYQRVFGDQILVRMAPVPFDESPFRRQW